MFRPPCNPVEYYPRLRRVVSTERLLHRAKPRLGRELAVERTKVRGTGFTIRQAPLFVHLVTLKFTVVWLERKTKGQTGGAIK